MAKIRVDFLRASIALLKKDYGVVRVIGFHRVSLGKHMPCRLLVCNDGSVSVNGDDVEAVFEFSPIAVEEAVKYVESRGYVRDVMDGDEEEKER